jgi:hypothetical protein
MAALLDLVRKLIDYGKELAATLHQRTADNPYFLILNYATNDLALVMARITRGLLRAQVLEERLARARGRARPDDRARPARQAAAGPAAQRKPRPAARQPVRRTDEPDLLAHLPTAEEIAAHDRRRPIGAVILDICVDLGIPPSHPLWRDIQRAVWSHGGSLVRLTKYVLRPPNLQLAAELITPAEPPPPLLPPSSTGPP